MMVTMVERMMRVETKLEQIDSKLDEFIRCADKRYAPKWIMNILAWVTGILAVVITVILIKFIYGGSA